MTARVESLMTKQAQKNKQAPRAWPRPRLAAGWTSRLIAEEPAYDRGTLWRIGSWGGAGVAALIAAIYVAQSPATANRQSAEARVEIILRQQERLQKLASDNQVEARRLSAAVDVLNSDRDRTFVRITSLEQGVESITGSIERAVAAQARPASEHGKPEARTEAAVIPPPPIAVAAIAAPAVKPPQTIAPAETRAEKPPPPAMAAPPAAPDQPATTASAPDDRLTAAKPEALPEIKVKPDAAKSGEPAADNPVADRPAARTEFGVDLGTAASVGGLRALWGKSRKKYPEALANLRPVIAIRERTNGLGIQLRLLAGPLLDAATAARICAAMVAQDKEQDCETSVFDGQQLPVARQAKAAAPDKTAEPDKAADRPKESRRRQRPQPATNGIFPFARN